MDDQLRFDLPAPMRPPGSMTIWVMAADADPIAVDRRHVFVDPQQASGFVAPGDVVLLRQRHGVYTALATERLGGQARKAVLDHLAGLLASPELTARRSSDVREATHIALTPGRSRGKFVEADEDIRSRTPFENVLLQVAARHGADRLGEALSATRLAEGALSAAAHPLVHGIFKREHGDMLSKLFTETGEIQFARHALPAYLQAAEAFAQAGLSHQKRRSRERESVVRQAVEQPWLFEFSHPPLAALGMGYSVSRLCGFALSLEAPGAWYTAASSEEAAFVPIGSVFLTDATVLSILAGVPSSRRRAVAIAHENAGRVVLRAGLAGTMHAALGALDNGVDHSDVLAISIECETLAFDDRPRAFHPSGPVTFAATPQADSHEVALHIAMMDDDDLVLRFNIDKLGSAPRAFI